MVKNGNEEEIGGMTIIVATVPLYDVLYGVLYIVLVGRFWDLGLGTTKRTVGNGPYLSLQYYLVLGPK